MKARELQKKPPEERERLLEEMRARVAELRFLLPQKKVKNVREISALRKDIARIETLRSKQL